MAAAVAERTTLAVPALAARAGNIPRGAHTVVPDPGFIARLLDERATACGRAPLISYHRSNVTESFLHYEIAAALESGHSA